MSNTRAEKSAGFWDVCRKIRIAGLQEAADATEMTRILEALNGVKKVKPEVEKARVIICYDASRIDYKTISAALQGKGFAPAAGWWSRLKGGWYQFNDSNARENARLPPPACCNKPPPER